MPRETKSNGQKDLLDRFYTPIESVEKCLQLIDLTKFDYIVDCIDDIKAKKLLILNNLISL